MVSPTGPVAVLGGGVMGTGIAATTIGHGVPVVLVDTDVAVLERARQSVAHQLRHAQMCGALPEDTGAARFTTTTDIGEVSGARLVVEAVVEDVAVKNDVLARAESLTDPGTPLVTNTSGIPVDELAGVLADPGRLVGTHFMNPTYLIKQVEVVRGRRTREDATVGLTAYLDAIGRRGLVVADTPGFVTSRLLHPMINDAARLVGEGVATAAAVDELMQGCLGHATGPLRTGDLIGLDNLVDALTALHQRTGVDTHRPCDQLVAMVRRGDLGRKSGQGFYSYREGRT
jgi:methoxymalonate biosynthesis protein